MPFVVDVYDDRSAQARRSSDARPEVVIHQLTDLPDGLDPDKTGGRA